MKFCLWHYVQSVLKLLGSHLHGRHQNSTAITSMITTTITVTATDTANNDCNENT